jgi:hypothetical protein
VKAAVDFYFDWVSMMIANNNASISTSVHGKPKSGHSAESKKSPAAKVVTELVLKNLEAGSVFFVENPVQELPVFRHEGEQP